MEYSVDCLVESPRTIFDQLNKSYETTNLVLLGDTGYANNSLANDSIIIRLESSYLINPAYTEDPMVRNILYEDIFLKEDSKEFAEATEATSSVFDSETELAIEVGTQPVSSSAGMDNDLESNDFMYEPVFIAFPNNKNLEPTNKTPLINAEKGEQSLRVLSYKNFSSGKATCTDANIYLERGSSLGTRKNNLERVATILPKRDNILQNGRCSKLCSSNGRGSKVKRAKPEFGEDFDHRADKYWGHITKETTYQSIYAQFTEANVSEHLRALDETTYKRKVAGSLLPNYVTIESFGHLQGIDGWYYEENTNRGQMPLSMRWCGQNQNFYNSFVYRYHIDKYDNRVIAKEFLCPYCPFKKYLDLNIIFHSSKKSHYMHHMMKSHGVYTTGEEMPIPLLAEHIESGCIIYCCPECGDTGNINLDTKRDTPSNCLGQFWRHCSESHNHTKLGRSAEQKREDRARDKDEEKEYLYEENFGLLI